MTMRHTWLSVVVLQLVTLFAFTSSYGSGRQRTALEFPSPELREHSWLPRPLYDAADVVSDEQLGEVLLRLRPKFPKGRRTVNFIEHALRVWGADAAFDDPECMSGSDMVAFLTNHEKFVQEYSTDAPPLIVDTPQRLDIRWAGRGAEFGKAASRHHDHWLACLLEGGVDLNHVVHSPTRDLPLREWLMSAVNDFRLDEQEYEWSSMVFAYTLAPGQCWSNDQSRRLSFDLIAERLLRGDDKLGVCHGTHRLYALAVLARLNEESSVLCPQVYTQVCERLQQASETLVSAQEESGCWNQRWSEGSRALDGKDASTLVDKVLVTGHHLEWLSITPQDWLPPHDRLVRAGQWLVRAVHESSEETVAENYTFYSHVVGALSNWRSVRPSHFLCPNAPASALWALPLHDHPITPGPPQFQ